MWQVEAIADFLDTVARNMALQAAVLEPGDERIAGINDHLVGFYADSGRGYLNSDEHRELDVQLGLSQRSGIVVVQDRNGRLLSTVRITSHPFEGGSLVPAHANARACTRHFELSRLVSWHGEEFRTLSTALALGTALLYARNRGALGLVALARTPQRRVFAKFGLKPTHVSPVTVEMRENGDYWFLEAPILSVVEAAFSYTVQLQNTIPSLASSII
ncbi:hypothetical protein [Burkholderia glumae]|nr:hypothetical protein [Burkholderia glumae]MCM2483561.1 hypothetical protein [Burkholderia glumae]MCM2493916.1 hypothetical protein [Burkholderia glumae]MCM2509255.1 hypothetical protein [Burkholderia glumae]MCM2541342.1 hypothetical protein [Burkholderia glumae]MCM2547107.1 hypothetical protein [Burkholderia glumae]